MIGAKANVDARKCIWQVNHQPIWFTMSTENLLSKYFETSHLDASIVSPELLILYLDLFQTCITVVVSVCVCICASVDVQASLCLLFLSAV